ncbi:MAG TPA: tetratricopeptide repeat protein [Noviherbaspirillum sp.]|nr:tetratricopeptide repeat protein [Noviherbaspirillum sp.]
MKWRDVVVGAVASLLVTIVGGVAVFYATKEPDDKKSEKLVYSLNQTAQFSGGTGDVVFSSLTLSNVGGAAAKHVLVSVALETSEIKDLAISTAKGLRETTRERTPNRIRLVYDNLLPQEQVTINLLLTKEERPTVSVRSDASLGQEIQQLDGKGNESKSKLNIVAQKLVPLMSAATILLAIGLFSYLRRRGIGIISGRDSDRNNTGFVLLHSGLTAEAEITFSEAIRAGNFDHFTLSNAALCKAVQGKPDEANGLLKAATFSKAMGHAKAVILFNEGLIHLQQGDKQRAISLLKEAILLSPKQVPHYCQMSVLLDGVRSEPAFSDLIRQTT